MEIIQKFLDEAVKEYSKTLTARKLYDIYHTYKDMLEDEKILKRGT